MEKERIQQELKYYRSYKVAIETTFMVMATETLSDVRGSKRYETASACRVTSYDDDIAKGAGGGSRAPRLSGGISFDEVLEIQAFEEIVNMLDLALDALTEIEREVITLKWMDDITLKQIADQKGLSPRTANTIHRRALDKMHKSLRFYYPPEKKKDPALTVA